MAHMSAHATDHPAVHHGTHVTDPAPHQKKKGEASQETEVATALVEVVAALPSP